MSQVDEPASFGPKPPAAEARKAKPATSTTGQPSTTGLIAFTIDAATARIVKVERVDPAGARHELSEDERTGLAGSEAKATLEAVIEQAFEAGIDCVLGDKADDSQPSESEDDADLSRALLRSLIERSAAKRLMQRDVLSRAIMATLVEQAVSLRDVTPESTAAH